MLNNFMKRIAAVFTLIVCLPVLVTAEERSAEQLWYDGFSTIDAVETRTLKVSYHDYMEVAASMIASDASAHDQQSLFSIAYGQANDDATQNRSSKTEVKIHDLIDRYADQPLQYRAVDVALGEGQGRIVNPYGLMHLEVAAAYAENSWALVENTNEVILAGEGQGRVLYPLDMLQLAAYEADFTSVIADF